jgi:hypothetical protein
MSRADQRVFPLSLGLWSFRRDQGPLGRHHSLAAVSLRCTPDAVELQGNDTEQGHGANNG